VRVYDAADRSAPTLVLAHGAGAGHDHPWMKKVAQGLADRGVRVITFDFPYKALKKSVPDKPAVLEEAFAAVWREAHEESARVGRQPRAWFAGGKSMGGRISSQVAAKSGFAPAPAGLIFFGYPLHPPGKPEQRRDAHLPAIRVPMLFLHGSRDPFGTPEEMTELAGGLKGARLHLVEGGDHSLEVRHRGSTLDSVLDVAATFLS
jgi:uncharacterized protein